MFRQLEFISRCDIVFKFETMASFITLHYSEGIEQLYLVSYLWYPAIGAATTVVVALFVSAVKGIITNSFSIVLNNSSTII